MRQVHLAALDDGLQVARFDVVDGGMWHQCLEHGVAGLAGEGLRDLALPPGQLGVRYAGVGDFIDDVINFTAKSIKRGDGGASVLGQEQKSVVKAAAGRGRFFLHIAFRCVRG